MLNSTKSAIILWSTVVVPSLLPFLIISELLQQTAITNIFAKLLSPLMNIIFKLPGITSIALFLGMTGGYPVGAKVTANLRNSKSITQSDAKHLISFTNNAGPLFLSGAIGIGLYNNSLIGFLLILVHYLSAILVGFLFRFLKKGENNQSQQKLDFKIIKIDELGFILSSIIKNSVLTVCTIGGFILLFSLISTIFEKLYITSFFARTIMPNVDFDFSNAIISGLLEVTNGANKIALSNVTLFNKLVVTSMLIGFGGFSIHMQTMGVISNSDIKFSYYLIGKSIQAILSGILTFIFLSYTSFGKVLFVSVSTLNNTINSYGFVQLTSVIICLFLFIVFFKIIQILKHGLE